MVHGPKVAHGPQVCHLRCRKRICSSSFRCDPDRGTQPRSGGPTDDGAAAGLDGQDVSEFTAAQTPERDNIFFFPPVSETHTVLRGV